jgi:ribosomal subunit interface protein
MLNYNIKATGLSISDELRGYIEKKLELHASKFISGDSTAHTDVEVEYQALRHGDHYRAEFTLQASGEVYRAESWGPSMHEAIDIAIDELTKELRRHKRKYLHLFRRGATRAKDYLRGFRDKI